MVANYYRNANEPYFLEKAKKATGVSNPARETTKAIVEGIWRYVITGPTKENPSFETVSKSGAPVTVGLKFWGGTIVTFKLDGPDSVLSE